jgi:hypothetical protein
VKLKGDFGIPPTVVGGLFKSLSKKGFEVSTHCRGGIYDVVQALFIERIRN